MLLAGEGGAGRGGGETHVRSSVRSERGQKGGDAMRCSGGRIRKRKRKEGRRKEGQSWALGRQAAHSSLFLA